VVLVPKLRIWKMQVSRYAGTFAGTPEKVTLARNQVWDYLAECPAADDAALVVTEFASNAVLHSLSRVGTFTVRCQLFRTYVWVEVEDEGGDWCRPEPDGRPHGLDIVSLLAGEGGWGIEQTGEGQRVVWARLELPSSSR
jgi:anti-sigma regulatory factor (Ser/Thr protein kinase)